MPYQFTTDKKGNRHFGRVLLKAPKAAVVIEPPTPAVVEPVVPVEAAAVQVPTAPKKTTTRKRTTKAKSNG